MTYRYKGHFRFFRQRRDNLRFTRDDFQAFRDHSKEHVSVRVSRSLIFVESGAQERRGHRAPYYRARGGRQHVNRRAPIRRRARVSLVATFRVVMTLVRSIRRAHRRAFLRLFIVQSELRRRNTRYKERHRNVRTQGGGHRHRYRQRLPVRGASHAKRGACQGRRNERRRDGNGGHPTSFAGNNFNNFYQ